MPVEALAGSCPSGICCLGDVTWTLKRGSKSDQPTAASVALAELYERWTNGMIVPVILSGGSGTRLWPMSTAERPKQFLPLIGETSLFRATLERVADRGSYHPPLVVANIAHKDLCLAELAAQDHGPLILEPCVRNTAAAIIMAAEVIRESYGRDQVMLVMPSDHVIGDVRNFRVAVKEGLAATACA